LVVLGGDKTVGIPRSVEHAWQLREMIRRRGSTLALGGWANPHADPERQADFLTADNLNAEYYLTQIVSHHHAPKVDRFVEVTRRRGVTLPGMFGVFYYRSANPRTLAALKGFLPVPAAELTREFEAGDTAEDICARTIRTLTAAGARHFYVSNLPVGRAQAVLTAILDKAGVTSAP
jgi:hypothetical protein